MPNAFANADPMQLKVCIIHLPANRPANIAQHIK
jgi:hypothetical protein